MEGAGAVVVLHGSASSVGPARYTYVTQATAGVPGTPEAHDGFGQSVTSADLDRDGYADLADAVDLSTVAVAQNVEAPEQAEPGYGTDPGGRELRTEAVPDPVAVPVPPDA
ncbi:hypothetical protein ADL35_19730, partial [Streptomyces sp. NRRL WC-3753]